VDVQEVRKLDDYLKTLFGNARIRVVPQAKKDLAAVVLGEEKIGDLTVDDEDDDRSYNFRMEFHLGEGAEVHHLDTYLKRKFNNDNLRVMRRAKKQDSLEVYLKDDFIGVLFIENERGRRSFILEIPILEMDLPA
jgi:hypothetical protein